MTDWVDKIHARPVVARISERLERSCNVTTPAKKKETFELEEPSATTVELLGDFTNWEQQPIALKKQKGGLWRATIALDPGAHEYRFRVDGQWRDDSGCDYRRPNPFGGENCVRDVSP